MRNIVFKLLIILFYILNISISLSLMAKSNNGWVSSGGDNTPGSVNAAWFLGYKDIYYCIKRDPGYSVETSEIKKHIAGAIATWKNYYDVHSPFFMNKTNHPNFNLILDYTCDNTEELVFYFGTNSNKIQKLLNQFYGPYGFSTLESYDPIEGSGQGLIWIADPERAYPDADPIGFHAMLLHELGHVFGNSHLPGTIMDENIAQSILATGPKAGFQINDPNIVYQFTNIDGKNKLFFHYADIWNFNGYVPFNQNNPNIINLQHEVLNKIFNRNTTNDIAVRFENRGPWVNYHLILKDAYGYIDIPVQGATEGAGVTTPGSLFKTYAVDSNNQTTTLFNEASKSWTFFTTLTANNGETFSVVINLFTDDNSPVQIRLAYKNQFLPIFQYGSPVLHSSNR